MKMCIGPECDRAAVSKDCCSAHYNQLRAGRELTKLRPRSTNVAQIPRVAISVNEATIAMREAATAGLANPSLPDVLRTRTEYLLAPVQSAAATAMKRARGQVQEAKDSARARRRQRLDEARADLLESIALYSSRLQDIESEYEDALADVDQVDLVSAEAVLAAAQMIQAAGVVLEVQKR